MPVAPKMPTKPSRVSGKTGSTCWCPISACRATRICGSCGRPANWISQLPVILVTGYPSVETAIRGIDMAIDAYLTKPLDIDELLAHVRRAVERSPCPAAVGGRHRASALGGDRPGGGEIEAASARTTNRTNSLWGQSAPWLPACRTCWSSGANRQRIMACTIFANCWIAPSGRPTARPFSTRSKSSKKRRTTSSPSSWRSCERSSNMTWGSSRRFRSRYENAC